MKKVVTLNGSPHGMKGNTGRILQSFIDGMESAGGSVKSYELYKMKINPCTGCYSCWLKTPGVCIFEDDFAGVLEELKSASILVLASPVYVDGMTGTTKVAVDRIIPLGLPFVELQDGHMRHPSRHENSIKQTVLVSNCGFWERDNFDPMIHHVEALTKNLRAEFAGALIRPHGPMIPYAESIGMNANQVFDAAKQAGVELISEGKMNEDTLARVSADLVSFDDYFNGMNISIQTQLDKHISNE